MRISAAEFRKQYVDKPVRRSKYNNKSTRVDGINFHSQVEADYYGKLKLREIAGDIKYFLMQVPFRMRGGTVYRLDFMIIGNDGEIEYVDVKGVRTKEFMIKKREIEAAYGIKIKEVKK